ncbi:MULTISPECIES: hypothetical protein [unclassified Mycolicibacterium]|uniref:hypothetical protein n=1 Tax=unclassified Mycolicibacterium TaxID=2636767 RepID=UPI002ED8190F
MSNLGPRVIAAHIAADQQADIEALNGLLGQRNEHTDHNHGSGAGHHDMAMAGWSHSLDSSLLPQDIAVPFAVVLGAGGMAPPYDKTPTRQPERSQ